MSATLTAADVADDLHVSRDTAVEYIRTQVIPGGFQAVTGGKWLVDAETYAAWKAERRAAVDPHRIEPRSARSNAARKRR